MKRFSSHATFYWIPNITRLTRCLGVFQLLDVNLCSVKTTDDIRPTLKMADVFTCDRFCLHFPKLLCICYGRFHVWPVCW